MTSPTPYVLRGKHRLAALIAQTLVFLGMTRTANRFSRWWTRHTCLQVIKSMPPEMLVMLVTMVGAASADNADEEKELLSMSKRITGMMSALNKHVKRGTHP